MSETGDFGLGQIGQVSISVRELERAVRFYRDTLGMRLLFEAGPMAFFDCGTVRLMLAVPEAAGPGAEVGNSILYYRVPDIGAAFGALAARGVRFEGEPHRVARLADHDLWVAFCRDVEGNLLALMSEVRR